MKLGKHFVNRICIHLINVLLSSLDHVTCIRLITVKIFQQKLGIESDIRFILFISFYVTGKGLIMPPFNRVHVLTETAIYFPKSISEKRYYT